MLRNAALTVVIAAALLVTTSAFAAEPAISGQYIEIRSCDVYTGPCFANGEMGLTGEEAILTWAVERGEWRGVDLDGLNVIAVVRASATLGDTAHSPYPARAVLIVDERADGAQREALSGFARYMGGRLLEDVVRIEAAPIEVAITADAHAHHGHAEHAAHANLATDRAVVRADGLVDIQTRSFHADDLVCGNETLYYPPLTDVTDARGAFTSVGVYSGEGLGVTFDESGRRSAYLATFSR